MTEFSQNVLAVVMAAGSGSRMSDLTHQFPKCLLPVGLFPMMWYPIKTLENAGFLEVCIVVRKSEEKTVRRTLANRSLSLQIKMELVTLPDNNEDGTAGALRLLEHRVKDSMLVVSCDFLSDCDLKHLMTSHFQRKASLTALLSDIPAATLKNCPVPGVASKGNFSTMPEKISIGFGSEGNGDEIVFWRDQVDMEEEETFELTRNFINRHPCARIQSKWTDMHVYMINKSIFQYLKDKKDITSIQQDLVPRLVEEQMFSSTEAEPTKNIQLDKQESKALNDDSTFYNKAMLKCFAYKQTEGFCFRANTISSYFEACKQISRLARQIIPKKNFSAHIPESTQIKHDSQVADDCILGENVWIGQNVSIKRSVIGKNSTIDDKVKITNSVLMDNVTISESCVVDSCIIAGAAVLGEGCCIRGCVVGQAQEVPDFAHHESTAIFRVLELVPPAVMKRPPRLVYRRVF